ncbi:MAG: GNAT family N-acetyltransferase [Rhizobiaceae bacterium]
MTNTTQITSVANQLPENMDILRREAQQEGFCFVECLITDWESGENRFEYPGEVLMVAYVDGELAGIGGITVDPTDSDALRMRRFYVRASFRRQGLARLLTNALLESAEKSGKLITVNAGTPDAPAFWEAMSFEPHDEDGHSHILPSSVS